MGSFDMMCAISGLPIECGTKTKLLFLGGYPYEGSDRGIGVYAHWFPRSAPLDGVYADYGQAEDAGPPERVEVAMKQFRRDIVTRAWGENACHDVQTRPSMSLEEIFSAIQEERLRVREIPMYPREQKVPKGVPTLKRVTKLLLKRGFKIQGENGAYGDLLVSKFSRYAIKVRGGNFAMTDKRVEQLRDALSTKYAVAQTVDVSSYADRVCFWVGPKPDVEHLHDAKREKTRTVKVGLAMVREDVWTWICAQSIHSWSGPSTVASLKTDLEKKLARFEVLLDGRTESELINAYWFSSMEPFKDQWSGFLGMGDAIRSAHAAKIDLTPFVETEFVSHWLAHRHDEWRPSRYGGQQRAYEADEAYFAKLTEITHELRVQQDIDQEENE